MERPSFPTTMDGRHELEEAWRDRLEESHKRYQKATNRYRKLLAEERDGQTPRAESPLAQARQSESEALMEYSRVLRLFTDLTVHGKLPNEIPRGEPVPSTDEMIAVIDDDESIRDSTNALLRSSGHRVRTFESAEVFLDSGELSQTECIVLDVRMPGMDGLELQRRLNASHADIPIIFVSAHDDSTSRRSALDAGAVEFLIKPFQANALVVTVQTALARRSLNTRPVAASNGDR